MTRRFKQLVASVAALAALALGGAVFAQAQSGSEPVGGPDRDNIQQGDQTSPDNATVATASKKAKVHRHKAHHVRRHATRASGSQTAGEQPDASEQPGVENPEQSGEQSGESATGSDGPGGHADEANGGNANADHQFQGQE
ncbi:MAG: hypothetical protein QOJ29_1768 [Thermoleophilaceae bacterium]|jgi:hypothetical protein|nr:hypothetical protein [Thermoleophilaceae bacterium]